MADMNNKSKCSYWFPIWYSFSLPRHIIQNISAQILCEERDNNSCQNIIDTNGKTIVKEQELTLWNQVTIFFFIHCFNMDNFWFPPNVTKHIYCLHILSGTEHFSDSLGIHEALHETRVKSPIH